MTDNRHLRIQIEPKPNDHEMVAITAAVLTLSPAPREPESKPVANAWREASKRESLRIALREERS